MIDLQQRSFQKEQMDLPGHSMREFRGCLADIDRINRWTLAHRQNFRFIEKMYFRHRRYWAKPLRVLDVGCGSGDFLRYVEREGADLGYDFHLTGLDLNPLTVEIAKAQSGKSGIRWVHGDFLAFSEKFDVIVSSLVAHHLSEGELKNLMRMMARQSCVGWLIHDLHRHVLPYYFISNLTRLAQLHPIVQNDAPLSVARGFRRSELKRVLSDLEMPGFHIDVSWRFPFKYLVTAIREFS